MNTSKQMPPQDPQVRKLVNLQMQRRTLLRGASATGIAAGITALLAACGTDGLPGGGSNATATAPAATTDISAEDKRVLWDNWTLYLDYDEDSKTYPTLADFERQSGLKVEYTENIDANDSYFGKIQAQLARRQDIGEDIIVLTDWVIALMRELGYAQMLDHSKIPNLANLAPSLVYPSFDPNRNYSLTWQSVIAGLAWNKEAIPGGLSSVEELFQPKYKGKVAVLNEMRDTAGLLMLDQGVDISGAAWGDYEFANALEVLKKQLADGQIRQVTGNSYKDDLISGNLIACIAWSGDITQLNSENGDKWGFAIPEKGAALSSDNMVVPVGSPRKSNAEQLMNYYYEPEVAAQVAGYVNYMCPVPAAKEILAQTDEDLANNPLIFPSEQDMQKLHEFRGLTATENKRYNAQFQTAIGN